MDFYSHLEDSFPSLSFLLGVTKKEYIPIVASCPSSCPRIVTTHDESRAKGPQRARARDLSLKFGHPITGGNNFPHCLIFDKKELHNLYPFMTGFPLVMLCI